MGAGLRHVLSATASLAVVQDCFSFPLLRLRLTSIRNISKRKAYQGDTVHIGLSSLKYMLCLSFLLRGSGTSKKVSRIPRGERRAAFTNLSCKMQPKLMRCAVYMCP